MKHFKTINLDVSGFFRRVCKKVGMVMDAIFPLTRARSLGEREKRSSLSAKAKLNSARKTFGFFIAVNGCSFSPREKVRMRGKTAPQFSQRRFCKDAII
jgi:hypothetical protein